MFFCAAFFFLVVYKLNKNGYIHNINFCNILLQFDLHGRFISSGHQIVPGAFAGTVNFYAGDFYEKIRMYADCAVRGDAF